MRQFFHQFVRCCSGCDRIMGTQFKSNGASLLIGFNHDDHSSTGGLDPLHRTQPNRSSTLYDGYISQANPTATHCMKSHSRRLNLSSLNIAQRGISFDNTRCTDSNARSEATMFRGHGIATKGGHERDETTISLTSATRSTLATRWSHCNNNAITLAKRFDFGTDCTESSRPFMSTNSWVIRCPRLVGMDIGTADTAIRDVDDHS